MPKGINDPGRADRIAAAALEVVSRDGVEGLTHRAVAATADVPLGSTTYHYRSLEDLLKAALSRAKATTDIEMEQLSVRLAAGGDLVDELCDYLMGLTEMEQSRTIVEHELYLTALRRPGLRSLSLSWADALPRMLASHADPVTAQALAYVFDGILLQSILQGRPRPRPEVELHLRRAAGAEAPASS